MCKTWIVAAVVMGIVFAVGCGGGERAQKTEEALETVMPAIGTLDESDPLYATIEQLTDATSRGDLEALRQLVAEDCQFIFHGRKQSYWDVNTKEVLEAAKASQITTTIEEIKVLERTDNKVTVRVVTVSKGKTGGGRATSRNVYRKYDGKWKLAEGEVESFSVSTGLSESGGRIEDKIPTEAFAQHIRLYPEAQFTEMKPEWGMGSGPLFGIDEQLLSCVQGTTPDSVAEVLDYYRNEMKGNWQNFRESIGFHGFGDEKKEYITLAGEQILSNGKKIGINIRVEKEAEGSRMTIVMAPLKPEEMPAATASP